MISVQKKIIDFHAHILPGFDDGPETAKEAAEILMRLYEQGVTHVISTSHFYRHKENIEDFIIRRNFSYNVLRRYLYDNNVNDIPKIIFAAEVYFTTDLVEEPDLQRLCIEGTDYMLIELPYAPLTQNVIDNFRTLAASGRVKPILAHIERYIANAFADEATVYELLEIAPGQLNCDSFLSTAGRLLAGKLIKTGNICAIGTDVHNMSDRAPHFAEARKKFSRRAGSGTFLSIMDSSAKIIENEEF